MRILIVEDDVLYREELRELIEPLAGVSELEEAGDIDAAEARIAAAPAPDLVLLDVHLPRAADPSHLEVAGPRLAQLVRQHAPRARIVVVSGVDPADSVALMLQDVVDDYVSKEAPMDQVEARIRLQLKEMRREAARPGGTLAGARLIGDSAVMEAVRDTIRRAARSAAPVLVTGESGCGKELAAAALHAESPYARGPFVPFHPAAVTEGLLESELFGHAKGAFTGAVSARAGVVEAAEGGTLFLDEIGELPMAFQVKLLRFLEDGSYFRAGEDKPRKAQVRLVFATNRDLAAEVTAGRFREDLRYRLDVLRVRLPPLRDRLADVPSIAQHMLTGLARGRRGVTLTASAEAALQDYSWPGNVRELRNVLERLLILGEGETLDGAAVRGAIGISSGGGGSPPPASAPAPVAAEGPRSSGPPVDGLVAGFAPEVPLKDAVGAYEAAWIRMALDHQGGNVTRTAEALGVGRRTLQEKMARYQLRGE